MLSIAGLTINDVYLQGVTNLAVKFTGATGYTFDQISALFTLYAVTGTTLAFDLTYAVTFQIQYANGTDYNTSVISCNFNRCRIGNAQAKTSGTLYFKNSVTQQ